MAANFALMLAALAIEAVAGYPDALFRRIGHPVSWIGALIARLDSGLNRPGWGFSARRAAGVVAVLVLCCVTGGAALALHWLLLPSPWGWAVEALLASTLLAQRSLYTHVADVAAALEGEGLPTDALAAGRAAVSRIVGRDPHSLDAHGVARAAIESLAENFSDGVVAPVFWGAVAGLPGLVLYKAINTADSMIGHRSERYLAFGWAAARLDDVVNLLPARLTALFLVLAVKIRRGAPAGAAAILRQAPRHKSPNAGWPESAMAWALDLRLAGPRVYGAERVNDPWMGSGRAEATADDIRAALNLYRRTLGLVWGGVVAGLVLTF